MSGTFPPGIASPVGMPPWMTQAPSLQRGGAGLSALPAMPQFSNPYNMPNGQSGTPTNQIGLGDGGYKTLLGHALSGTQLGNYMSGTGIGHVLGVQQSGPSQVNTFQPGTGPNNLPATPQIPGATQPNMAPTLPSVPQHPAPTVAALPQLGDGPGTTGSNPNLTPAGVKAGQSGGGAGSALGFLSKFIAL